MAAGNLQIEIETAQSVHDGTVLIRAKTSVPGAQFASVVALDVPHVKPALRELLAVVIDQLPDSWPADA